MVSTNYWILRNFITLAQILSPFIKRVFFHFLSTGNKKLYMSSFENNPQKAQCRLPCFHLKSLFASPLPGVTTAPSEIVITGTKADKSAAVAFSSTLNIIVPSSSLITGCSVTNLLSNVKSL